jgi:hypothetical protein
VRRLWLPSAKDHRLCKNSCTASGEAFENHEARLTEVPSSLFSFTAIPGEGYRTLRPGTPVRFELVENERGPTARNVRRERPNHERSS